MISNKEEVQVLAALMLDKGITDVVISPGSRNAPLINTFENIPAFRCFNIVDERSAAFFAMGLALRLGRPVAVACTSGSAMLNYAPAVSEAFYQKIPLLVLSADRPHEWIDQGVGQTIRQDGALANFVKESVSLTGGMRNTNEKWHNTRVLNKALNALSDVEAGPVHINLPFAEPLYDCLDIELPQVKGVNIHRGENTLLPQELEEIVSEWTCSKCKLILVGQMQPDDVLQGVLLRLTNDPSCIVLSEKTSNVHGDGILSDIDNMLFSEVDEALNPDLLITIGGQLVSKKIKSWLQKASPSHHWHFSPSAEDQDTFMALTRVITVGFERISPYLTSTDTSDYADTWSMLNAKVADLHQTYLEQQTFCDFTVIQQVLEQLPNNAVLHLSNSTPVRYAQLFPMKKVIYQSNRGTSGIDGVISTASGYAHDDDKLNVLIIGDLSFFYDSNAMWNQHFPSNLKVILINNEGGGIFKFIPGPTSLPSSQHHFIAEHKTKAEGIVSQFGLDYDFADNRDDFNEKLEAFLHKTTTPGVLEVNTSSADNAEVLRSYFTYIKNNIK